MARSYFVESVLKPNFANTIPYLSFLYFLPFIVIPFSPFYSYMLAVFVMIGFSAYITKPYRILLGATICLSIALIYASRLYFNLTLDFDDDFSRYYQNYLDVYDDIAGSMTKWGDGFEVGLSIFYKILSLLLPKLSPQYVLFFTALTLSALLWLWLELYGIKFVKKHQKAALIAFGIFILAIFTTIGATRQAFACVFLLYGFFTKSPYAKCVFFTIAISFHTSSVLVIILNYMMFYFPRISLAGFGIFFVSCVFASVFVGFFVDYIGKIMYHLPGKIGPYFVVYLNSSTLLNFSNFEHINIMKSILMLCVIFVMYVVIPQDRIVKKFKVLITISFLIGITSIVPSRIVFLVTDFAFYFVVFIVFRKFFRLALLFFFPYFLKLMYNILVSGDSPQTLAAEYFFSYPESSIYPFYYFFQGVAL